MTSIQDEVEIATNSPHRDNETTLSLEGGTPGDLLEAAARWWREIENEVIKRTGSPPCLGHFDYEEEFQTGEKFLTIYWKV